jgi:hypothetical protein
LICDIAGDAIRVEEIHRVEQRGSYVLPQLLEPRPVQLKIGARGVRHGRYVVFQLAEVAVPRAPFAEILRRIDRLRPRPSPFSA